MKILSIAFKDLQILFKDRGDMFLLFLLPLFFIVVFSGALSAIDQETPDTRIPLPVVDLDGGETASKLIAGLDAAGGVRAEPYADQAEAMALLEEKKIQRVLIIPASVDNDLATSRTVMLRLVSHPNASSQQTEAVKLVVDGVAQDMALEGQILAALRQMGDMTANEPAEYQQAFGVERAQAQARSQFDRAQTQPLVGVNQMVPAQPGEQEALPSMADVAVPGMAVLTPAQVFDSPQVSQNGMLVAVEQPEAGRAEMMNVPFRLGGASGPTARPMRAAPRLGEHTDAVLREAGYSPGEIAALRATGAVR